MLTIPFGQCCHEVITALHKHGACEVVGAFPSSALAVVPIQQNTCLKQNSSVEIVRDHMILMI